LSISYIRGTDELNRPNTAADMSELDVLLNAEYFVDTQLWPLHHKLNAKGWLDNFTDVEKPFAVHLLNGFLYFCPDLVDQMFKNAFQSLRSRLY
jgi:hypothetical protein